jgi:hypothetical protein
MGHGSNKVLDRKPTLEYLHNKFINKERLVVSRYNDGEYLLMNGIETKVTKRNIGNGASKILKDLLNNSLKNKNQLVCTAYIGSTQDIPEDNIWYKTHKYVVDNTNNEIYGCSNWATYDFCTDNILIPKLFSGYTLVVSGISEYFKPSIQSYNKNLECYQTPNLNAEKSYITIKSDLLKICKNFKNIILACGPLSKVLLVDLIDVCNANLLDLGCLINAICHKEHLWSMSWAQKHDINPFINNFKFKVRHDELA